MSNNIILASADSNTSNAWPTEQSNSSPEITTNLKQSSFIQEMKKVEFFPSKLEHSGYIILSSVALLFSMALFLLFFRMRKAIKETQKNSVALKHMATSLFISQQNYEYKTLLDEFIHANTIADRENTRIQLLNFMNYICKEICEAKDKEFGLKLGASFLSKIQGRYLKMGDIKEGADYFRFVGSNLANMQQLPLSGEAMMEKIRRDFRAYKRRHK